ncbi:hypothetical protein BJP25_26990 [Actinokineospora bangkokensis]|uniref:Uncharacterized protein n=1 Tax=Actinokineospora bangkokensis TaxID=1193682 RepID=A0A1Q9LH29_9PSEU|nr:hypothetical protein BJP25_26990 [Actinokineospora bangkokensis]
MPDEEVVSERVEDSRAKRLRGVGVACSVVSFVVGLFAVVLALHIVLTLAEANAGNGFASFVRDFSGAVSLGFEGLFSPGSQKLAVLLDYGMAIIVWLLIGAAVNFLIRRFFTPGVNREVKYRRRIT